MSRQAIRAGREWSGAALLPSANGRRRWQNGHEFARGCIALLAAMAVVVVGGGCTTIKHRAIDTVGDALAAGGSTFASDDDPQLVGAATPFSLKLIESLLAERPNHQGLLLAAASGFTQYAFAFVQQDADEVAGRDFAEATALRTRARRLYVRARDYGLRGLEVTHGGFGAALRQDPSRAMRVMAKRDVPLLYWTAAAWAAAISVSKDNPDMLADLGLAEALIDRAAELDPDFGQGAIHAFLITYEMARPAGDGEPEARARHHFSRAMTLAGGQQAGPLVSWSEAVCVPAQRRREFESSLQQALAIDPDAHPAFRLNNLVMQRRARWLLGRIDEFFPVPTPALP